MTLAEAIKLIEDSLDQAERVSLESEFPTHMEALGLVLEAAKAWAEGVR